MYCILGLRIDTHSVWVLWTRRPLIMRGWVLLKLGGLATFSGRVLATFFLGCPRFHVASPNPYPMGRPLPPKSSMECFSVLPFEAIMASKQFLKGLNCTSFFLGRPSRCNVAFFEVRRSMQHLPVRF